jgi:outer membrane protein assembly factor BamA
VKKSILRSVVLDDFDVHSAAVLGATVLIGSAYILLLPAFSEPLLEGVLANLIDNALRYGSGGEDSRLFPLFVGYPNLVRGYDVNTFDVSDCFATATSDCPAFDRLIGSRVLVGNLELRFPLLRPFGASQRMYGPVPVEVALFTDAGVAWNRGEKPSFLGGTRDGVASAGAALRVNFLGFAVGEFSFAHPFQRPGRGWIFQFNLSPGF